MLRIVRCVAVCATFCLAAVLASSLHAADPKPPLKVLLVCGGCCHDYDAQKTIIADGLEARANMKVTVVHQGGSATNSKIELYEKDDWSKGYDLVIHDECFADVKEKPWLDNILKPHREGLPGVVVHCAMHCYRTGSDDWFEFCGVTSRGHGAHYPHEVLNRSAEHPIMKKFGAGWANPAGELYAIERLWETAHPLASAKDRGNGKEQVCVWTNEYRKNTRVFGTTLGHHNETVSSDEFLNLLTRGCLWACNKLDDSYLIAADAKPKAPKLVPENLALGKKATASTEEKDKGNLAPKAFDGNLSSRWCPNGPQENEWLQVDLGKPENLTGAKITWESTNNIYRYRLEGSTDGRTWNVLVDGSKNNDKSPNQTAFKASGVQYVRVTFLGSSAGGWGSISEFEVHGEKMTEVAAVSASGKSDDDDVLKDVKVPAGFEAKVFAVPPEVIYPVYVAAAPDGVLYVSVDKNGSLDRKPNHGAIYRLRDVDGDGRADETKLFVSNVDSPRGLVWDRDRLYVMHPPHLSVFVDKDGDGISEEQQILVKDIAFGFKDRPADHTSNGVTLGIDGWLYLAIGDFGFMNAEGTDGRTLQLRGGGVVRVRPDGTGMELYSRGTRNILDVAVDPLLNAFSRDNTNDGGGWDIRLHHYSGLEHHGYPSLYKNFADEIVQPLADYGGGSGCGGLYMDEPGFPAGYGNALYTCDWGRNWVYRHSMTPKGATFTPDQNAFIGATRVTDLDVDAMSRLYVASWRGATFTYVGENVGYIVRVTPKGYTPQPLPDFKKLNESDLIALLKSDSHRRRLEAQRELIHRSLTPAGIAAIKATAVDAKNSAASRVAAIFTLKQALKEKATVDLLDLAKDATIREYALRAAADRADENKDLPTDAFLAALADENPRVRNAALIALARIGREASATAMTKLTADADPIVAHTAIESLILLKPINSCLAVLDRTDASPAERKGALRVLQAQHDARAVDGLLQRLEKETSVERSGGLIVALCRLANTDGKWTGNSWGTRPDTSGPYYQPEKWSESEKIIAALKARLAKAAPEEAGVLLRESTRHKVPLDGGLERVLALAKADAKLLPIAIEQIVRSGKTPNEALPVLYQAAEAKDLSPETTMGLVQALGRSDKLESFQAALRVLPEPLEGRKQRREQTERLRDALLNNAKLDLFVDYLAAEAGKLNGRSSVWSDAALIRLLGANNTSVEVRETVNKQLTAGWSDVKRRGQLIEASLLAKDSSLGLQIMEAVGDADPKIASAAKDAVKELQLEKKASNSPLVETFAAEKAVEEVVKAKGRIVVGQQLFNKMECTKCHTVRQEETPKGPYLGTIANTYKRKELVEAILIPSKTLAQGFVTNLIVTDDGKQITGFVTQEGAEQVVLRNAEGKEVIIPTASIEERTKLTTSIMPEGLAKKLTIEELASIIDYLQSLPKK